MMVRETGDVYNNLFRFESIVRAKKGTAPYPVHKKLRFADGSNSIPDWIESHFSIPDDAKILDAGCGVGYTLIKLCQKGNRTGLGITLSEKEAEFADRIQMPGNKCQFTVASFDEPINDHFDVIIAIESLKHSRNLQKSVKNLTNHLNKDGKLIVIDDFSSDKKAGSLKNILKQYWSIDELYSPEDVIDISKKEGYQIQISDLTPYVMTSNYFILYVKMGFMYFLMLIFKAFKWNSIFGILFSGYYLEWLYKKLKMRYMTFVVSH